MIGVNISGAEYASGSYPTTSDLDYLQSKGVGLLRLPIAWEKFQPTLNGPLDPTQLTSIESFLDNAAAHGMQVIVDLHNYGRYSTNLGDAGSGNGQVIGSAAVPISSFATFWGELASQLKGHPGLAGYDIMNEPHDMGGPTVWPQAAQAAVDAIRSVDAATTIYVEGDGWATASNWLVNNANLHINDPANNLVYEAHQYFESMTTGDYAKSYDQQGATPNMGVDDIQPFLQWLNQNNARGFMGEFGVPDNDPRWLPVLNNFLSALQANGLSGTYWNYRTTGTWYNSLGINPLVPGQDRAQMAALTEHAQPIINALTSGSGIPGDAVTRANVLTLTGTAASNSTVDVFDGGALMGVANADNTGRWSLSTSQLLNGSHSFTATFTDSVGITSEASIPMNVTVNTSGSALTQITTLNTDGSVHDVHYYGIVGQAYTDYDVVYGGNAMPLKVTYSNGVTTAWTYSGTSVTKAETWNADGTVHDIHYFGITGTTYTDYDVLYGANGKPASALYSNGTTEAWSYSGATLIQTENWNADKTVHDIHYYGVTGQAYTDYDIYYGANGKPAYASYSNGMTTAWTYNGSTLVQSETWNPDRTVHDIHTYGITGQAYTDYDIVYGAGGKNASMSWYNGAALTETKTWNADGTIHDVHYYGITGQAYTDYDLVYGANNQLSSASYSNGTTGKWTYNADGSLHELVYTLAGGQTADTLYGPGGKSESWHSGLTLTETEAWNADGTVHDIHYYGITGQAYTNYDTVYGAGGKSVSESWYNGAALTEAKTWNADGTIHDVHYYGITGQAYTDYDLVYGANNQLSSASYSNGTTGKWTYNADGSLHELLYTLATGQSTDTFYGASQQTVVQEVSSLSGGATVHGFTDHLILTTSAAGEGIATNSGQTFNFAAHTNTILTGGGASETFDFAPGYGNATITDLVPNALSGSNHDVIAVGASAFSDLNDLLSHAIQSGANTIITDHVGDTLTLDHVVTANLSAGDFIFHH
jgi:hypothetical protein